MWRAFELIIINIWFDWPLACRSQLHIEALRVKISLFQSNLTRSNGRKVEVIKLGQIVKSRVFLNLDDKDVCRHSIEIYTHVQNWITHM